MSLFNLPEMRTDKTKNGSLAKKTTKASAEKVSVRGSNDLDIRLQLLVQKVPIEHPEWLITTYEKAKQWVDNIVDPICIIDTEGTGVVPLVDRTVGFSAVSLTEENPVYIPFGHVDKNGELLKDQLSLAEAVEIFQLLTKKTVGIYHNAEYDIRITKDTFGLNYYPSVHWCTQTAACLLNENESHRLKDLWPKYCGQGKKTLKFSDLFEDIPMARVAPAIVAQYAVPDVLMTRDLYNFQLPYLTADNEKCVEQDLVDCAELLREIELPLIEVVAAMEDTGIAINMPYAKALQVEYGEKLEKEKTACAEALTKLLEEVSLSPEKLAKLEHPINMGSPSQLAILIYDGLKLISPNKEKPRGTGEDIIEKLADKHPALASILKFRTFSKLVSTYINPIPGEVLADGKIHTSFNRFGAKTGRFSSSDPVNMQNIPVKTEDGIKIRKMFVASPGYVLTGGDFSQQEPRVLTHISQDPIMLKAYAEDRDIYAMIGSYVFQVPYEDCLEFRADGSYYKEGASRRKKMKVLVLAKMYGNGDRAVAEDLGITLAEAKKLTKVFNDLIPGAEWAANYHRKMAHEKGYVKSVFGRKRRLPDAQLPAYEIYREKEPIDDEEYNYFCAQINKCWGKEKQKMIEDIRTSYGLKVVDNGGKIADAERQAMNHPMQGTGADVTKAAMVKLYRSPILKKLGYRILFPVHDEIIGECPEENWQEVLVEKKRIMESCCLHKICLPMKVDMVVSREWMGKSLS